jgi:hypothetical protein
LTDAAGNPLDPGAGFDFTVLAGDANHDRTVDFNDLVPLAQHYNGDGGALWADGDFTADGLVDFNDLVLLAQNYNRTLEPPIPPPPPPPPPELLASSASFDLAESQSAPVFSTVSIRKAFAVKRPPSSPVRLAQRR